MSINDKAEDGVCTIVYVRGPDRFLQKWGSDTTCHIEAIGEVNNLAGNRCVAGVWINGPALAVIKGGKP